MTYQQSTPEEKPFGLGELPDCAITWMGKAPFPRVKSYTHVHLVRLSVGVKGRRK